MFKSMLKEFFIVLKESLTNPDKEYSSKKLMTFISFNFCVFMATIDLFTKYKINMEIFYTFMSVATGISIVNIFSNKMNYNISNEDNKTGENLENLK